MKILITGTSGFIGYHTVKALSGRGHDITGIDNINDYYDVNLKLSRLADTGIDKDAINYGEPVRSTSNPDYNFIKGDIMDTGFINELFRTERFDLVCHLAAQAGVRYSIENPHAYVSSNVAGFLNILEAGRKNHVKYIVYASSSSVYGKNSKVPFSEADMTDDPVSLYAATKKSNELMANVYSNMYGIPMTGLRFFTVYGPWGRPDMAPFIFMDSVMNGRPIRVFNHGNMSRDFTYIDDIVSGICSVVENKPEDASHRIYNIGHGSPVNLMDFIRIIEEVSGKKAVMKMEDMQSGDVQQTYADTSALGRDYGYAPEVAIEEGLTNFYKWYRSYYNIDKA
ncbi:MAG: NAD-dependent epimerase/dehydratase family protein [Rikenellaceae bacterium]|nr:NAD-dependent epimerase/dehydratase family protein [Rikenellaceae bacterium]